MFLTRWSDIEGFTSNKRQFGIETSLSDKPFYFHLVSWVVGRFCQINCWFELKPLLTSQLQTILSFDDFAKFFPKSFFVKLNFITIIKLLTTWHLSEGMCKLSLIRIWPSRHLVSYNKDISYLWYFALKIIFVYHIHHQIIGLFAF